MGLLSNKISRDNLSPGDHIYSWRQAYIYAHHVEVHNLEPQDKDADLEIFEDDNTTNSVDHVDIDGDDNESHDSLEEQEADYGIYVGDGKVVHFTRGLVDQETSTGTVVDHLVFSSTPCRPGSPCLQCGDQSKLDGVICSCIDCFLYGGDLYLFKYNVSTALFLAEPRGGTCTLATSDPVEEILHRASFLLKNGSFGTYHLFKNNCENFAIYCKTGLVNVSVGGSGQVQAIKAAASVVASSSPLGFFIPTAVVSLTVVGCGVYWYTKYRLDIGVRSDVSKVPVELLNARFGVED
ncbi:hypothetical protein ACFE04_007352 [Oxalis oulophora]